MRNERSREDSQGHRARLGRGGSGYDRHTECPVLTSGQGLDGKGDKPTVADQTTLDLAALSSWDSTPEELAEGFAGR